MKGIRGIPLHAILILLLLIFVLPSCGHRELPSISVCARIAEDRGDTITIQWYVKNTSDFPIAFAENHLAVWQTNLTEEHVVPTGGACGSHRGLYPGPGGEIGTGI